MLILFECTCLFVSHVHMWKTEVDGRLTALISRAFETGSLTEPGARQFGQTVWPVSHEDPPVSASLALGSQAFPAKPCIQLSAGIQMQVLMLCSVCFTNWAIFPTLQSQFIQGVYCESVLNFLKALSAAIEWSCDFYFWFSSCAILYLIDLHMLLNNLYHC